MGNGRERGGIFMVGVSYGWAGWMLRFWGSCGGDAITSSSSSIAVTAGQTKWTRRWRRPSYHFVRAARCFLSPLSDSHIISLAALRTSLLPSDNRADSTLLTMGLRSLGPLTLSRLSIPSLRKSVHKITEVGRSHYDAQPCPCVIYEGEDVTVRYGFLLLRLTSAKQWRGLLFLHRFSSFLGRNLEKWKDINIS